MMSNAAISKLYHKGGISYLYKGKRQSIRRSVDIFRLSRYHSAQSAHPALSVHSAPYGSIYQYCIIKSMIFLSVKVFISLNKSIHFNITYFDLLKIISSYTSFHPGHPASSTSRHIKYITPSYLKSFEKVSENLHNKYLPHFNLFKKEKLSYPTP